MVQDQYRRSHNDEQNHQFFCSPICADLRMFGPLQLYLCKQLRLKSSPMVQAPTSPGGDDMLRKNFAPKAGRAQKQQQTSTVGLRNFGGR
jgi:hypothetical protein